MNQLLSALLKSDLFWQLPALLSGIAFFSAAYIYFPKPGEGAARKFKILASLIVGARLFYSAFLSFFQYYVWKNNTFTDLFLNHSANPASYPKLGFLTAPFEGRLGYFSLYIFERFWLEALITVFLGYMFYLFLKVLRRHNGRYFEEGEPELGFAMALLAGWPGFVFFLFFIFIFIIATSIFRMVVFKQNLTTFGIPFLLSALTVLILGEKLLQFSGLKVLVI